MNSVAEFFRENTVIIYFVYGLAFFVLGLAIALENRRTRGLKLWAGLWFLAAFGILHAFVEWTEMFALFRTATGPDKSSLFSLVAMMLLAISAGFLVHFGANLIVSATENFGWLLWAAPLLFVIWAVATTVQSFGGLGYEPWLSVSSILARYIIYLPGSLLSAVGMALHIRVFRELNFPAIAGSCRWAALAFALNAMAAGMIVPAGTFFPASVINGDNFFALTNVPHQVFRALAALTIAFFVVRVLRVFEAQQARQLEKAHQDRHRAQKAALEMQRIAHEEAERWSRELEKKVQERTKQLEQRNRELLAINTITMGLASSLDLPQVLEDTLGRMSEMMDIQISAIYLLDEESGNLALEVSSGIAPEALSARLPREFLDNLGFERYVNCVDASRACPGGRGVVLTTLGDDTHCCIFVPIRSKENTRGVALLARRGTSDFAQHEVNAFLTVCSQIAVVLDNAQLYNQVQNLAVLEERDRIAREMHDGLAQILGYLNLETYSFEELLRDGKSEDIRDGIQELRKIVQDAYADVRESILNLRTSVAADRGLIPTLEQYVREYSQQSKVSTELVIGERVPPRFPQTVEVQLVRIIQEALTNVRKHANATRATLKFENRDGTPTVTIEDNGRGFDLSALSSNTREHFGIQSMGERTESIGGVFAIESDLNRGTRVSIMLPSAIEGVN